MRRFLSIGILALFLGLLLPAVTASAVSSDEEAARVYEDSGAEKVFETLDDETLEMLDALGLDISDPESIVEVSPARVVSQALSMLTGGLSEPLKKCAVILGAVLLFSILENVAPDVGRSSGPCGMIFMLSLSLMILAPVADCVGAVLSAIRVISGFTKLLIPVMAGLVAASGSPVLSAAFSSASLGAAEVVGEAVDTFFVPVTGAYAAVCIVAAVNPMFNLQNIALFFRRIFTVVLGGVSTLFSGVLALKGAAASSTDSLVFKGAKFLIGGLVPVVGGALSEGLSSVTAALQAVNKSVGALGILVIVLVALPSVLEVLTWWAALYACSLAATLTGQPQIAFYLSGVSNVIVMLNILLVFDVFVFTAALGIVLGFAGG